MDIGNTSSERDAVVQKIAQIPNELVHTVSDFLDSLIEQHTDRSALKRGLETEQIESSTKAELSQITTWEEWFDTMRNMPDEAPHPRQFSKQEQRDLITEAIVEKYQRKGIDLNI